MRLLLKRRMFQSFINIFGGFKMSLAKKSFLTAVVAPVALAAFGLASNANAAIPEIGKCAPADTVKMEMTKAGYVPLVPFDKTFLKNDGTKVMRRDGLWSNDSLTEGYYIARDGLGNMCNQGKLSEIILADNRTKKIDTRILSKSPKANQENGLNLILNNAAKNASEYPMIHAKITDSVGSKGFITIVSNPETRVGGYIASNAEGTVVDLDTLDAGEKDGQKYGPQYTPIALAVLDKKVNIASSGSTPTFATYALK